mmetsp:Transcript_58511/g.85770  ORF Transcript_58511/g.85770 Transcript_58511/m.85770 type:complete len:207 (+) Transcript_58511:1056-1676(+)
MAFMTRSRSNPISMICMIVASTSSPTTSVDADDSYEGPSAPPAGAAGDAAGAAAAGAGTAAAAVGATGLGTASGAGSTGAAGLGLALLTMTTNVSASATPYSLTAFPSSSTLPLWITLLTGPADSSFASILVLRSASVSVGSTSISAVAPETVFATHFIVPNKPSRGALSAVQCGTSSLRILSARGALPCATDQAAAASRHQLHRV